MIVLFLACLVILVIGLQYYMARYQIRQLVFEYSYDRDLTGPGEPICLTAKVKNVGRLPVFYAGLSQYITNDFAIRQTADQSEASVSARFGENRVNYSLLLMPHRQYTAKLYLTADKRGKYKVGKYFLEAGDLLGLTGETRSEEMGRPVVVMPARSRNLDAFQALSGYLGDFSVRRFIFEDPILTVGTRDYTGREPMKAIAWSQTARTGRMQVHVYDHTAEATATVLLSFEGGTDDEREECLRLTRSVLEKLEHDRISYDFYSNGDISTGQEGLSWMPSGLGDQHFGAIMRGCGCSKLTRVETLDSLIDRCTSASRGSRGYILITPPLAPAQQGILRRLQENSDYDVCVLTAEAKEEGGREA